MSHKNLVVCKLLTREVPYDLVSVAVLVMLLDVILRSVVNISFG
jgi:hypothetical protein